MIYVVIYAVVAFLVAVLECYVANKTAAALNPWKLAGVMVLWPLFILVYAAQVVGVWLAS